jgi:hypothetical protein
MPTRAAPSPVANTQPEDKSNGDTQGEKTFIIHKEVLSAIANRLDDILEK